MRNLAPILLAFLVVNSAGCAADPGILEPSADANLSAQAIWGRPIVVGYRAGHAQPAEPLPMRVDEAFPRLGMALVEPYGSMGYDQLVQTLRADPAVAFADPDGPLGDLTGERPPQQVGLGAFAPPAVNPGPSAPDPVLSALQIGKAWQLDPGEGQVATVSVLDTGVDPSELRTTPFYQSFNGDTFDHHGHGTMVAGVVAGPGVGLAPNAPLVVGKILDGQGNGRISTTVQAFDWVLSQHPSVIVMAICAPQLMEIDRLMAAADAQGVTVVASVGNSGHVGNPDLWPAAFAASSNVVAVGAWDTTLAQGAPADFTGVKPYVTLVAPAVAVPTLAPSYPYTWMDGQAMRLKAATVTNTAMACGIVGGLVALMQDAYHQHHPKAWLSPSQVKSILETTADFTPLGGGGGSQPNPVEGYGEVDPVSALQAVGQM